MATRKKHASRRTMKAVNTMNGLKANVQHLAAGMMMVTSVPQIFKTIVGAGFVVAIALKKNKGGGLLHIPARNDYLNSADKTAEIWLQRFMRQFASSGLEVSEAKAELIGGADLLRRLPHQLQFERDYGFVNSIESFLKDKNIQVVNRRVGGSNAREVTFNLATPEIEIRALESAPPDSTCEPPHSDRHLGVKTTTVEMGCLHVDRSPNRMIAILGSCVGIALFDPATCIGGLAHVMMPQCPRGNSERSKYADTAVPELLKRMEVSGAKRNGIVAKIMGGANVIYADEHSVFNNIASRNIEKTRESLRQEEINICSEDVGGKFGRKIRIDLTNFHVMVRTLTGLEK